MRRYETIFILRPSQSEEQVTGVIESTHKIILDDAGTIISLNKWGIKKLAYLIKKESLGYYVFCDFAGTPAAVAELERRFRIDDAVLKYMTVKLDDDISEEEIQLAIGDFAAKEAAAKEAAESGDDDSDDDSDDDTDK